MIKPYEISFHIQLSQRTCGLDLCFRGETSSENELPSALEKSKEELSETDIVFKADLNKSRNRL